MESDRFEARNSLLTRILLDRRCLEHQEGRPHHQLHTVFGMSLFPSGTSSIQRPTKNRKRCRRTLDGRIILVYEVALNELDRQGGLADACPRIRYVRLLAFIPHSFRLGLTTTTDDDKLVLSQELCLSIIRLASRNLNQRRGQCLKTHPGHVYN
jgi:hypothetical protein